MERPHLCLEMFDKDSCPEYTALSYEWGDSSINLRSVRVNEATLTVTKNLWAFLMMLHSQQCCSEMWFWCDQVSLNQQNVLERDHQVGLMGDIYAGAKLVYAWIGHLSDVPAFDIGQLKRPAPSKLAPWNLDSWPFSVNFALTLLWMATQSYWTRLWVAQELGLARHIEIWFRTYAIDWASFTVYLSYLAACVGNGRWMVRAGPDLRLNRRINSQIIGRSRVLNVEKITTLIQVGSPIRQRGLEAVLTSFCESECADLRDKVFGLQALVLPEERVNVDYSLTAHVLLLRTIQSCLRIAPQWPYRWHAYDMCWSNGRRRSLKSKFTRFDVLAKSMKVPCRDAQGLYWAFIIQGLSQDLLKSWHAFEWMKFWALWHEMHATAVTSRQKLFAKDLEEVMCASTYSSPEKLDQELYDALHQRNWTTRKELVAARMQVIIDRVASQHGFVKYGEFLAHPLDWPFQDEKPTQMFDVSNEAHHHETKLPQ